MAAQLDRGIALEVDRLLQQFLDFRDPVVNPFRIESVDVVSRLQRAKKNVPGHRAAVFCIECVNVFLRKEEVTEIEQLQVRLQKFFRNVLV